MDIVARAAEQFGDAPLLKGRARSLSFIECDREAGRLAATLGRRGIMAGDIVATVSANTPEMLLLLLAMLKGGIVAAPLNHHLPESRLRLVIERLKPRLVVSAGPPAFEHRKEGPSIDLDQLFRDAVGTKVEPCPATDKAPDMERLATVMHTSASTGYPKAAVHSVANHWYNAEGSNENLPFTSGDTWLLSLPLFHVGGYSLLFRALASGGCLAVDEPGESISSSIRRFGVTHLSIVPTQLYRLLAAGDSRDALQGLKSVLLGGSAVHPSLIEEARTADLPVWLSYGSTEMASQIATTSGPVTGVPTDSGTVLRHREVQTSAKGELLVRGKCLFKGYLTDGLVRPATDGKGWFHTADAGSIDHEGRVRVTGRIDNMFISGGENIHPEEVEKELMAIDGVLEALVVPIPDPEYGQRAAAFVRTARAESPADEEMRSAMQERVGGLKAPERYFRVCQWATLPGSQKIDRRWYLEMAREYRGGTLSPDSPCA